MVCLLFLSCDSDHRSEFYRIQRDDIRGYEGFIRKYPSSSYVDDAKERIEAAKAEMMMKEEQARIEENNRRLESLYGSNSLSNGAQPYSRWYGSNLYFDDYTPHSEIVVKAPASSDVIALVRYNNSNGRVAGHRYIRAGQSATIYLQNGNTYQTFFYYGKGWYPDKEMKDGIRGGFLKQEHYSKDGRPSRLENEILTYELILQQSGNFQTSASSIDEMF